jgi:hypothetical protein
VDPNFKTLYDTYNTLIKEIKQNNMNIIGNELKNLQNKFIMTIHEYNTASIKINRSPIIENIISSLGDITTHISDHIRAVHS